MAQPPEVKLGLRDPLLPFAGGGSLLWYPDREVADIRHGLINGPVLIRRLPQTPSPLTDHPYEAMKPSDRIRRRLFLI